LSLLQLLPSSLLHLFYSSFLSLILLKLLLLASQPVALTLLLEIELLYQLLFQQFDLLSFVELLFFWLVRDFLLCLV